MARKNQTKDTGYLYLVQIDNHIVDPSFDLADENGTYVLGPYKLKDTAIKKALEAFREVLPKIYCEHGITADGEHSWGDWDDLPDTEAERDPEDYEYSKESVIELIRKNECQVRIEDSDSNYFDVTISRRKAK